ncbi:UNVERIFIED_CONTAM: hypothetical protein FKN15_047939 [Acipenser sinensis]
MQDLEQTIAEIENASQRSGGVKAYKQQEQDPTNLYISNLPISMDEQELENMLKPFGHVISTRILRDANGVSRGVGFARMESTEKCEVVIQHFNGKYLKTPPGVPGHSMPFKVFSCATGMALTYDPTAAMQNGFYSSPYSIATNRMIAQTSITPFIAASPVSTYQVQSTSWMPHQSYVMQPTVWWHRYGSAVKKMTAWQEHVSEYVCSSRRFPSRRGGVASGCYDNASNGPHHVNAASQYDGSSHSTDESSLFGYNRNRCYDNASNGPHHVNAASQYDGSSHSTDESSLFGYNRNSRFFSISTGSRSVW